MEIKIRNLDRNIVRKIDDIAKGQGKSRNEYLVEQITKLATAPEIFQIEDQYKQLVKENLTVIRQNTEILKELIGD